MAFTLTCSIGKGDKCGNFSPKPVEYYQTPSRIQRHTGLEVSQGLWGPRRLLDGIFPFMDTIGRKKFEEAPRLKYARKMAEKQGCIKCINLRNNPMC